MGLKPNRQHVPKLTKEQVIEARNLYYKELESYKSLAKKYNVSLSTIQKAIQGVGAFYSSIEDSVPEEEKDCRMPAYFKYSVAAMQRNQEMKYPNMTWKRKRGPYNKPIRYEPKEVMIRKLENKINRGK